ncbi:LacI family DNA-binding transcriptional regulator [Sulfitobacter sp. MF3-043]|uniref:LacI family DNA-binding transcriptional regulator n=1 Tax=Sulfitobacter sediminivivens TaxID=3252902 RepID=UPI0036DB9188
MKATTPAPTLYDVAARSGVSTATVSRCLNFPDQVTERTRGKVMEAVIALGYSPNFGARVMAQRRTNTIGAIIPTMENAIFARGLQAFQEELRVHGYTLLVASSSYKPDIEEEQIKSLVARGADALLLIGHDRRPEIYEFLEKQRVPVLVTWAFDRAQARPSVGFDNRAAMRNMARIVIDLGHRHLALISAEVSQNDRARERLEGIKEAMVEKGLNAKDLEIIMTPYGIENGAAAFEKLMQPPARATAVFCGNDVLAVGALRAARTMGLEVPKDVSIIGFDDIELAQVAYPALTTVHVPHREMGKCAARTLVDMLNGNGPIETQELASEVRMRASLGPAPEKMN